MEEEKRAKRRKTAMWFKFKFIKKQDTDQTRNQAEIKDKTWHTKG